MDADIIIYALCAFIAILALITIFVPDAWGAQARVAQSDDTEMANVAVAPGSLGLLAYALTPAADYWRSEGRALACKPQLYVYDEQGTDRADVVARAAMPGCAIYWNRRALRRMLREAYDPWRGLAAQGLRDICQATAHEYGHNLGLDHTEYGLMDHSGGAWEWTFPDGTRAGGYMAECKLWARAILRDRLVRVQRCETKRCVRRITQRRLDSALVAL